MKAAGFARIYIEFGPRTSITITTTRWHDATTEAPKSVRKELQDGLRRFRAHYRLELLACGSPHARQAAEALEQLPTAARANPGNPVELRSQIAFGAAQPVKGHGEAMRFVANPLQQQQR